MIRSRSAAVYGALALALLLAGCATPIGIHTADPREVQLELTRSSLTSDEPSDFTLNELRRYDLLEAWEKDPESALAKLHAAAVANGLPPASLFALAELSFLRAGEANDHARYAAAVIYAYALLFPEDSRAPLDELDPRQRITADLYNRALTLAFRREADGTLLFAKTNATIPVPFGQVTVDRRPDMLELDGYELYDLAPVAEIEVEGMRNRYRSTGIGAPLAAKARPLPEVVPVVPLGPTVRVPLTAVVRIDTPLAGIRAGDLHGHLDVFASLDVQTIDIDGRPTPLEAEPTAALAAGLSDSKFWQKELQIFLGNAIGLRAQTAIGALRPYKKGRIPVMFVHGTASSPARWADMVNDLISDPRLRERYAFWFFTYDSGNPIAYSGWQLREALTKAVDRADPTGKDPCARDMVVMGHSQGGLLTKLTAIDSGDAFWNGLSSKPFDEMNLDDEDKAMLRGVMFVKPLPFVTEVIFLATPQQGSYLAGPEFVRRLAERLVRLPSDVARVGASVVTQMPQGQGDLAISNIPTSIDNMSPGNRFIKALAQIPVSPQVITHSIIAVDDDSPLDVAGDGVVKYESAHIEPVTSELIVHSPHSGMQAEPATIEEVRRILVEHSARSACPMPD
jgi:pimeloyl-ACP methyl ester carboxylesterase